MSSVFSGKRGLRTGYAEIVFDNAGWGAAIDKANAIEVIGFAGGALRGYFQNCLDVDIRLALVHPLLDPTKDDDRKFWMEIGKTSLINLDDLGQPSLEIEPKTKLFIYRATTDTAQTTVEPAPLAGKFRVVWYGGGAGR